MTEEASHARSMVKGPNARSMAKGPSARNKEIKEPEAGEEETSPRMLRECSIDPRLRRLRLHGGGTPRMLRESPIEPRRRFRLRTVAASTARALKRFNRTRTVAASTAEFPIDMGRRKAVFPSKRPSWNVTKRPN